MFDGAEQDPGQVGFDAEQGENQGSEPDKGTGALEILYDKKAVCPLCGAKFSSKKIRSRYVKTERMDTDFCQVIAPDDPNPLHYYVLICPECSYGFFEDSAQVPAGLRAEVERILKEWRISHTKSYCQERTLYDVIATYRLAITLADIVNEAQINRAGLNLRLAWLFRGQKDYLREEAYLKEALKHYELSYVNSDFNKTNTTEMQLLYMTGELHRRLKNYEEAVRYFSMTVHHDDRSRYRKFVEMARTQWSLAREEHMQENNGKTNLKAWVEP
jgi:uncharacterized protein (DUF2225 family)